MNKRGTKATQGWVREYRTYFSPTFVEVKGRLFRSSSKSDKAKQDVRDRYSERDPDASDENTDNHEHSWFFDNDTPDGCRRNYVLAEAVRLSWDEILQRQFPDLNYRLFVSNEYMIDTEDDSTELTARVVYQQVLPTLRLWTHTPENPVGFEDLYRMAARGPNSAWWYNSWQFDISAGPLQIEHVFDAMLLAQRSPMTVQQLNDALSRGSDPTTP